MLTHLDNFWNPKPIHVGSYTNLAQAVPRQIVSMIEALSRPIQNKRVGYFPVALAMSAPVGALLAVVQHHFNIIKTVHDFALQQKFTGSAKLFLERNQPSLPHQIPVNRGYSPLELATIAVLIGASYLIYKQYSILPSAQGAIAASPAVVEANPPAIVKVNPPTVAVKPIAAAAKLQVNGSNTKNRVVKDLPQPVVSGENSVPLVAAKDQKQDDRYDSDLKWALKMSAEEQENQVDHNALTDKYYKEKLSSNYNRIRVKDDGDCFYHAIAKMFGGKKSAVSVRQEMANYAQTVRDYKSEENKELCELHKLFLDTGMFCDDESIENTRLSAVGCKPVNGRNPRWAEEPHALLASHVYKCPVTIYSYDNTMNYNQHFKEKPLVLLYNGFNHYELLIEIPGTSVKNNSTA